MGLNETVSAERIHIGFFGMRNAGKSSLVNAVTNQALSVVSEVKGTTTDPVKKAMELLPLGPVVIVDTPGLDDEGELGEMRVEKAVGTLSHTDLAVLVVDSTCGITMQDEKILRMFREKRIPYIIAYNKCDIADIKIGGNTAHVKVSARTGEGIEALKEMLGAFAPQRQSKYVVRHLLKEGDTVILVTPCDASAPKGRLILPQQQVLRELLDAHILTMVVQTEELSRALSFLKKPSLVITDSQAFGYVNKIVPKEVRLTSFSILFAAYKGDMKELVKGANTLKELKDGDKVLIAEGCTHHRQCNDLGSVKMPGWIKKYSGTEPEFHFMSGNEFPKDLGAYRLVVHCGGCMLNEREMKSRLEKCKESGIPVVNYGVAIAKMHGILERTLSPFSNL